MDADSAVSQVQRRIELQNPEDLTYLITNVRNAAAARLNEAFPQVDGGGEDELRNQIEALVNEYIDKTFTLAAPNLTINGLPVAPGDALRDSGSMALNEAYEPFDTRKRQKVAELITQEEKLLEDVASLKRTVPGKAAADHTQMLREGLLRDDEMMEAMAASYSVNPNETIILDGAARLERQETVEGEFKDAIEALGRLKRDMSTVVAKMERARQAGEYVITQGR